MNGLSDGLFDARDVAFDSVRLWRDLNQDGVSQKDELFAFAELGVQNIVLTSSASNLSLGGGNSLVQSGSFTRCAEQALLLGESGQTASLLLANNNFYRHFTDNPPISAEAAALPQMQGAGRVRDLRDEAMRAPCSRSSLRAGALRAGRGLGLTD